MSTIQLYSEHPVTYQRNILGPITEVQLDFLMENLEEEFEEDDDYFLNLDSLNYLKDQGVDKDLLTLLEKALKGNPNGVDILYQIE
jgi:hypothetical protein